MMKSTISLLIAFVVVMGLVFTGCTQSQSAEQTEPAAFNSTITADCIVHFYKTNASTYITRQQHGFNPAAVLFESVSDEPTGPVKCSLLKDEFTSSGQKSQGLSDLPRSFWNKHLAAAVFYSFCAGGGLLETGTMFPGDTIKVEGQWYRPLSPQWPSRIGLTLYQSLDTERIEMVGVDDQQAGQAWLVINYNLRYSKELSVQLPRSIDVFDIRNGTASKELMIRYEYKDVRRK
jgi:hypothetical protein